ncbi:MAG: hypothetical protein ACK4F7_08920 [Inhella sp.]
MISPATDTLVHAAAPRRLGSALLLSLACHLPLLCLQLGSPEGAQQAPRLQIELRARPDTAPPLPPPTSAEFATERPTAATTPPGAQAPPPPINSGLNVIAVESEQPATLLPPALAASRVRSRTEALAVPALVASAPSLAASPSQLPEMAEPVESSEAQVTERQTREAQRLAEAERLAQQQAQELADRQLAAQREAERQAAE